MSELRVGSLLEGRYRIEAAIATGGMSTVYRCVDTRLGRMVAAKVMDKRYHNDPIFRKRFEREAQAMAQLSHPCLVNVYDYSAENDQIYLIMELITGGTLRELLAERGPMPPHAAVAVMRPTLTGLKVAHDAGMVHRDIKPDNVLINKDHQIKLADFGLVRAISESQATTDQIVGTVSYLSPEQILGAQITPATDVYSAGILLFELLTGKTPFSGDTQLAHAVARLERNVPAPSSLIEGVPPQLDEIVLRATARQPEQRYQNAGKFLEALEGVADALRLPKFTVPVPVNSAAHRAEQSTETRSFHSVQDPAAGTKAAHANTAGTTPSTAHTHVLPESGTQHLGYADAETAVVPGAVPETIAENPLAGTTPAPDGLFPHESYTPTPTYAPQPNYQINGRAPAAGSAYWEDQYEADVPDPDEKPEVVSNKSRTKLGFWVTFFVLVTIAVAVGGWWFGSGRYGEVPQVVGLDEVAATTSLEDAGFTVHTSTVYSNTVSEDLVVSTDPAQGARAVRGGAITMFISRGKPTVPDIEEDRSIATVRAAIEGRQLEFVQGKEVFSDDVAQGEVVSLDPKSGTEVDTGTKVTATISKGAEPDVVPHIAGDKEDKARETLEKEGFKVTVVYEFDTETKGGRAIGTNPAAGEKLPHGSEITLRISTAVEIPDVVGMSVDAAQKELAEAGIQVAGVEQAAGFSSDDPNKVVDMSPSEGQFIDAATTTVTLYTAGDAKVPNTVGKKLNDAIKILQSEGFTVIYDDEADASDRVYWQSPLSGTAEVGSEVEVRTL